MPTKAPPPIAPKPVGKLPAPPVPKQLATKPPPPPKPAQDVAAPKPKTGAVLTPEQEAQLRRIRRARRLLADVDRWVHIEHIHPNAVICELHRVVGNMPDTFYLDDLRHNLPDRIERSVNLIYVTIPQQPNIGTCGMSLLELHTQTRAMHTMKVLSVYAINDYGAVQRANDISRNESQYGSVIMTEDVVVSVEFERIDMNGRSFDENWQARHRAKWNVTFGIARLKGLTCPVCLDAPPLRNFYFAVDFRVIRI